MRVAIFTFLIACFIFPCQDIRADSHDSIVSVLITRQNLVQITNGGHVAFPSIVRLPNDSLMVIYRKGNTHVDPSGKIMKQFGSPDGQSWTFPQLLYNDTTYDDRDPSLQVLSNGKLALNYFKYNKGNNLSSPPIPAFFSIFYSESADNGQSFTAPVTVDNAPLMLPPGVIYDGTRYLQSNGEKLESFATSSPVLEISNKIMIPAYGGETLVYQSTTGCYPTDRQRVVLFESDDSGLSWSRRSVNENKNPDSWLTEPSILKLNDGSMIMQIRSSDNPCTPGGAGPLRQSVSMDQGETFSAFSDFSFIGHAPALYQLKTGVLLSGFRWYNSSMNNQKTAFIYSINQGRSWSDTIVISECTGECGYPSFVELSDNKFMVSFYTSFGQAISGVIYNIDVEVRNTYSPDITHIPEESGEIQDLQVYPNPSNGNFTISFNSLSEGATALRIFSMTGNEVHKEEFYQSGEQLIRDFSMEEVSKGIYFIEVTSDQNSFIKKIIIN